MNKDLKQLRIYVSPCLSITGVLRMEFAKLDTSSWSPRHLGCDVSAWGFQQVIESPGSGDTTAFLVYEI